MRQFNCVSLLLLLGVLMAELSPSVATARSRELLVAATSDQGFDQTRAAVLIDAAVKETTNCRGRRMDERLSYRRFGTRKKNPSSHAHLSGRVPFASDYGQIKRHPPKHN